MWRARLPRYRRYPSAVTGNDVKTGGRSRPKRYPLPSEPAIVIPLKRAEPNAVVPPSVPAVSLFSMYPAGVDSRRE